MPGALAKLASGIQKTRREGNAGSPLGAARGLSAPRKRAAAPTSAPVLPMVFPGSRWAQSHAPGLLGQRSTDTAFGTDQRVATA